MPEFYFQERYHIAEFLKTADCPGVSIARASVEPGVITVLHIPADTPQRIKNTGSEDLIFLAICTPRFEERRYGAVE